MANSEFVYVTYIRTTPEKLWQALIEPEFTRQYWAETWQESEWKKGAAWRIMIPDGRVAEQRRSPGNRSAPQARPVVAERIRSRACRPRAIRA